MLKSFETTGDVRDEVNTILNEHELDLRVVGGGYYAHEHALTFGLANAEDERLGDAHCVLYGGRLNKTYHPGAMGEPTGPDDRLKLTVVKGVGQLVVPQVETFAINEGFDSELDLLGDKGDLLLEYRFTNGDSPLLIALARSTLHPANATDVNLTYAREIDNSKALVPGRWFGVD